MAKQKERSPWGQRLMSRTMPVTESGCLIWMGTVGAAGYGHIYAEGRQIETHRASWKLHRGPIPKGLFVCHHCDVPLCINPDHLFVGTTGDNFRDFIRKHGLPRGFPQRRVGGRVISAEAT